MSSSSMRNEEHLPLSNNSSNGTNGAPKRRTITITAPSMRQVLHGCIILMGIYLLSTGIHQNDSTLLSISSSKNIRPALRTDTTEVNEVQQQPQQQTSDIAWCLTFPNSGTTYILKLIQVVTGTTVATNYGQEHIGVLGQEERVGKSIPVFGGEEGLNGPFRLSQLPLPNERQSSDGSSGGYLLTKTHCAGYCFSDCPPNWYIYSSDKYLEECLRGARYDTNPNLDSAIPEQTWVHYNPSIVKKAVHLIRSPFDNMVSRFHHERRTHGLQGNNAWIQQYPDSVAGFKVWCQDADRRFSPATAFASEKADFDDAFLNLAMKTPCYSEVIKYVQWHNNAFAIERKLNLSTHIVHYEDLHGDNALKGILDFLKLTPLPADKQQAQGPVPEFKMITYDDYFTTEEKTNMAAFMKYLSSPAAWEQLTRYMTHNIDTHNLNGIQVNHAIADVHVDNAAEQTLQTPVAAVQPTGLVSASAIASSLGTKPLHFPETMPQLSWLMSFPNSGTTYTEKLIQTVTDLTVATNYGHEFVNGLGQEERLEESFPVYEGDAGLHGPFRLSSKDLPEGGFLLTKTHCGGYCFSDCPPNWYIYSPDDYLQECTRGARYSKSDATMEVEQTWVQYDASIVKKAVHLFRDPFDNVVSRFNHEHKTNTNQNKMDWLNHFPRNEAGFKAWCHEADNRVSPSDTFHSEKTTFDRAFLEKAKGVPCFAEFIKYVQWHNNAFEITMRTDKLNIPTHVVHYEDYQEHSFDKTLMGILDFVGLPPKEGIAAPPFSMKPYTSYYTDEERERIAGFLEYLGSPDTWKQLLRYMPGHENDVVNNDNQEEGKSIQTPSSSSSLTPHIAWLMSFPNSGTTYTERLVQSVTQFTVGTNYGHEHVDHDGNAVRIADSMPVYADIEVGLNGPFRLNDSPVPPDGFILTKTHCGGYCFSDCPPNWYLQSSDKFLEECLRGARYSTNEKTGEVEQTWVQYDASIVKKAAHLIRDPYDNIIARFHHEFKTNDREGNDDWTAKFTYDVNGFRLWCEDTNTRYKPTDTFYSEKSTFDRAFLEVSKGVPCYAEFIKYTQWHNNAFAAHSNILNIPYHIVKYEDYQSQTFDVNLSSLLKFVQQSSRGPAPEFNYHPYEGYYTETERRSIALFLKFLASQPTWDYLQKNYINESYLQ